MRFLCFLFLFVLTYSSKACINTYGVRIDGTEMLMLRSPDSFIPSATLNRKYVIEKKDHLWTQYQEDSSTRTLSDYAAQLIYLGEYETAISIYQQIEEEHPGSYATASNLGTAYELIGNAEQANYWIARSMQINPKSHNGSEWIHLKILDQLKIGNVNPEASILGLDFGNDWKPAYTGKDSIKKIAQDIYHQLEERLVFVSAPNPIVGALFFDLGNCYAQLYSVEVALKAYEEAMRFGFYSPLLEERYGQMTLIFQNSQLKLTVEGWLKGHPFFALIILGLLAIIAIVLCGYFIIRMGRIRKYMIAIFSSGKKNQVPS